MRHQVKGNALGRIGSHRRSLMRNLARAMVLDGAIRTTEAKAKALRPFLEPIVTRAQEDSVANRRQVARRFGDDKAVVKKLFDEIGPKYKDRKDKGQGKGGYLRIIKISGFRKGDGARQAEVIWS